MPLGLLALAIGGFGIGLTEFVIMGLLPEVAADFGVTEAQAGWFISGYALAVVVGALGLTAATIRLPRKPVLMGLLVLFIAGNAISAMAPTYELMMTGRIVAALCHGAFFGIGSVVAASLVAPDRSAGAIAVMFTGLTAANVLGVPLGTFLGQQVGWRVAFMVVTAIFAVATVFIAFFVPPHPGEPGRTLRAELGVFRIGQVWFALGIGAIGFGGFFAVYSYVAPLVTEVAGSPEWVVPIVLVLMGVGMTIGNLVGGHLADVDLKRTLVGALIGLAVVLVLLALTAHWIFALGFFVLATGFVSSVLSPTIQTRMMDVAEDNQSIAAALNHSALNMGNALGAFLGGVAIGLGFGFLAPAWVGVLLALVGLVIALVSLRLERSRGLVAA